MSYDIELRHPVTGETLQLDEPHHMRGGTYQAGGTTDAHLNVTYNYFEHFLKAFGDSVDGSERGIRKLYGMTGAESIPFLEAGAANLGDDMDDDYWKPTEGNTKAAIMQLLALARMRPDGVWHGD